MSQLTKLITFPLRMSDCDLEIRVAKKLKWIGGGGENINQIYTTNRSMCNGCKKDLSLMLM